MKVLNEAGPIPANVEVVVGVPSIHIGLVLSTLRDDIEVAAQNCGVNAKFGAYTGETCASQLVDMGVTWVRKSFSLLSFSSSNIMLIFITNCQIIYR